jgi:hypothetical protein
LGAEERKGKKVGMFEDTFPSYGRDEDLAAIKLQSWARMLRDRAYVRYYAQQVYEKLVDKKRDAYYYYNNMSGEASWIKPKFMGSDDFYVEENYDYYKSEHYGLSPYKIVKYLRDEHESKTFTQYNDEGGGAVDGIDGDATDDDDDTMGYKVSKLSDEDLKYVDYRDFEKKIPKDEPGTLHLGGETVTVMVPHRSDEEALKEIAGGAALSEIDRLLQDMDTKAPAHIRYKFQRDFGAPHIPFEHVVYDPPEHSDHPSVLLMRKRGIRVRASIRRRTARYKEYRILPFLDEAMKSNDVYTVRRGIAMAMELREQIGIVNMGYAVLHGTVAARRRLLELLNGDNDDEDGFATEPAVKPFSMRDDFLDNMTKIPPIKSNDWHKFTLAQLSELKSRIGKKPEEWRKAPERKQPKFAPVCWGDIATKNRELAIENARKLHKTGEENDDQAAKEKMKQELQKRAEHIGILSADEISQANEAEIRMANQMVFGFGSDALNGSLVRVNVHQGPSDHFGERSTISLGKAPQGYHQVFSFFAYDFPYPNTTKYDVYRKSSPVPRIKLASNERRGLQHRPGDREGKGEEHEADDKHLGWTHVFSFYAFYDARHQGTLENIVSEMYNPYRAKVGIAAPRGGWTRLFAMYTFPSSMYTVFELETGRAPPNTDVMVELHRVSMESSLPDTNDSSFQPLYSFYGFDRPVPNTKKYSIHCREDLHGATRISLSKAHDSNIVDEEEETVVHWKETYHFYAWEVPVRGTTKFYVQVADHPHRYKIATKLADRPWRPLLTFYAYMAPTGYAELVSQHKPIREHVLGGTAKAAHLEKKRAQEAVHRAYAKENKRKSGQGGGRRGRG